MSSKTILNEVLKMNPAKKAEMVQLILNSLDIPDKSIDALWEDEAIKRFEAYKQGKLHYCLDFCASS